MKTESSRVCRRRARATQNRAVRRGCAGVQGKGLTVTEVESPTEKPCGDTKFERFRLRQAYWKHNAINSYLAFIFSARAWRGKTTKGRINDPAERHAHVTRRNAQAFEE